MKFHFLKPISKRFFDMLRGAHEKKKYIYDLAFGLKYTRSVWFKLDTITTFLKEVEEFNEGKPPEEQINGLRIYFGIYTQDVLDDEEGSDIKKEYKNHLTTSIVTTKVDPTNPQKYIDFFIGEEKEAILALAINHGTLCPPDDICP